MGKGKQTPTSIILQMYKLYKAGKTRKEIQEKVGVRYETAWNYIRKFERGEWSPTDLDTNSPDGSTLSGFTPRQLMTELAKRGYKGKLYYTQEIDITNF